MELRIKDNSIIEKEKFNKFNNIKEKILDKNLKELEEEQIFIFPELIKEAEDLTEYQSILQTNNNYYKTSNIMGFLGYKEEKLIIGSRFSDKGNDYLFKYLLTKVMDFPSFIEFEANSENDNKLFQFLIFLFPYYLKKAIKKGLFKVYTKNKYNDINFKGVIDINRHVNKNIPFVGKIAYNTREFSYDNYLIELIRHTIEFIRKKSYGDKLLRKSSEEVFLIIKLTSKYKYYDRRKIVMENKKNPINNVYYREYKELQKLCIMILEYKEHDVGKGIDKFYGILFDGAWLWEEYVNTLISDMFYHPKNKIKKGSEYLFSKENRNVGLIYPDFISKDNINRKIADAKYKPIKNIRNSDYLQLLAYMFRFGSKLGYYIYPEKEKNEVEKLYLNKGTKYNKDVEKIIDISVIKLGIKIPKNSKSYEEFVKEININEHEFISYLMRN